MHGFESLFWLLTSVFNVLASAVTQGIAAYFLAGVFLWSGTAKLRRPALAAMALVDFGIVRRARPGLGTALAAGETGLAFVLATGLALRLSLAIAATLLWLFALLIARSLWLGEHFPCFCFGDSASKISIWTLNRTTLLALLASLLFLQTGGRASETGLLQGLAALALLGTVALAGRVPKLIALNAELAKRQRARNGGQPA